MIVAPYKRPPVLPTLGVLRPDLTLELEHGRATVDAIPYGVMVLAAWDTVRSLVRAGEGEALCWNNLETRWRPRRLEDDWRPRATDVLVLRLPGDEQLPARRLLGALILWRDWLARFGARPGTMGGAAWSLLRSTVRTTIFTGTGDPPRLLQTVGGRQELGPRGPGTYRGLLEHVDIPAAYAATLGALPYNGRWDKVGTERPPEWWAASGRPVFVRARVRIPELWAGPLPARSRSRTHGPLETFLFAADYPVGRRLQGVWTWQELAAAQDHGCRIERILETFAHVGGQPVFAPWWDAVQAGRELPGIAGTLAKMTGNALWGRFCLQGDGRRSVRARDGERLLDERPAPLPAHDLAETVSGRVRARLWRLMMEQGDHLVTAHTDGAWLDTTPVTPDGWRVDRKARRLDVLAPQALRYWGSAAGGRPTVVYAGVPAHDAAAAFEQEWQESGVTTKGGK